MTGSVSRSLPPKLPKYCHHRGTGQACVYLDGGIKYLGLYNSQASRIAYGELITQLSSGVPIDLSPGGEEDAPITINEICLGYLRFAEGYYVKGGKPTDELAGIRAALKPLVALYGFFPACEFGPKRLKVVRQQYVDGGACRRYANQNTGRIRRCFRWAVAEELLDVTVVTALETLAPLKAGRCDAPDYPPRHAVPAADLEAVKGVVKQRTRDIMELMLRSAARGGEVVLLTRAMIDMTQDVWTAQIFGHKTEHRGKIRTLYFDAECQEILRKYFTLDHDARLFPITRATISAGIKRACETLGIKEFTGHWLRHTSLTETRAKHGLEVTQIKAGHSHASTTELYAEADRSKLLKVIREAS